MPNSPRPGERWTAIVPVRSLTEGKSRLLTGSSPAPSLIAAFARDVLRACGESANIGRTIVVSPDASIEALAREGNSEFVPEPSASGINEAIASVRAICAPNQPVIGILADTPCLTGATLDAVLTHARDYDVSFVADAAGTGSTMWCAQVPGARSFFGSHSRAHHRASGAVELGSTAKSGDDAYLWTRARRDVDTDVDLWDAHRIGLGPATTHVYEQRAASTGDPLHD
ncbi:MAG: NTP transferase domain-containing protein [Actinomycetota bacterium]|nr:NTP transferase domain-containing protein [Actinomycetota bacterium]MEC9180405.1 NTP transferase domain-containing protein [Actinomycetota bacterium]MEE3017112.1 NTP transferase domain-containing protein [Actinomycetota bacterium]